MADTWQDIITDALYEINACAVGEPISPDDQQLAKRKLNRIVDSWQARRVYAYNVGFSLYTLTPGHQPHLIGPGLLAPDFPAAQRPMPILGAALVLTGNVDLPLNIRDDDWWRNQRVKSLSSAIPTDLYPSYDVPNVSLYFWPVPAAAYGVRLETMQSLQQVDDITQAFVASPGYNLALTLTLAEDLTTPFGKPMPPELPLKASRARNVLGIANIKSPRMPSADIGVRRRRGDSFNYLSGMDK